MTCPSRFVRFLRSARGTAALVPILAVATLALPGRAQAQRSGRARITVSVTIIPAGPPVAWDRIPLGGAPRGGAGAAALPTPLASTAVARVVRVEPAEDVLRLDVEYVAN